MAVGGHPASAWPEFDASTVRKLVGRVVHAVHVYECDIVIGCSDGRPPVWLSGYCGNDGTVTVQRVRGARNLMGRVLDVDAQTSRADGGRGFVLDTVLVTITTALGACALDVVGEHEGFDLVSLRDFELTQQEYEDRLRFVPGYKLLDDR